MRNISLPADDCHKRATLWNNEFMIDLEDLDHARILKP